MKTYEVRVPYSETVYGEQIYIIDAETKEDAERELLENDYVYHHDWEATESDHFTLFWDNAEWEEK